MKSITSILFIIVCCFQWQSVQATHIVGGELNYRNLGNNQYRITFKLYKDCGVSVVPFDDPAGIYVYDGNDQVIDTLELPIVERDTLALSFDDSCLIIPPDICVDFAKYEGVFTLPPAPNGYTLAYIRCCRNSTILNAEGVDDFGIPIPPDLIGATYTASIPGSTVVSTNSSPEFNELPPIILCGGQSINVDQSAFDADGDQLVYSLCTPNVGGSLQQVFGNPLVETPPFMPIQWVAPFNSNNVMGGNVPLTINPSTGQLTGEAPEVIGQFVVGVCVQEFRNGILLSENKRDFQFNVTECLPTYIALFNIIDEPSIDTINNQMGEYLLLCDSNLQVQFNNLSSGTNNYAWNFDDGSVGSMQLNPLHEFPDTGFYTVSLIAEPGDDCSDTMSLVINLQYQEVRAEFSFGNSQCYDPNNGLEFFDLSVDSSQVESWEWTFGDGQVSTNQHPIHFYDNDGVYDVALSIEAFNGCKSRIEKTIDVISLDTFYLPDTIALCGLDSVVLGLEINNSHIFSWQPSATLDDATLQQPIAFPSQNTTYQVEIITIRNSGDSCFQYAEITVLVDQQLPILTNLSDSIQCDSLIEVMTIASNTTDLIWSTNTSLVPIISNQNNFEWLQETASEWYFVALNNQFCTSYDSININQFGVFSILEDTAICIGQSIDIIADVQSNLMPLTYTWFTPNDTILNNLSISQAPNLNTTLFFEANNANCTVVDSLEIIVNELPPLSISASPNAIINQGELQLNATENIDYSYAWTPNQNLNDSDINNPIAQINTTTIFYVEVVDQNGCLSVDSIIIEVVEQSCDEANIFVPSAFSPNNDQLNDVFRVQGDVIEAIELKIFDRWGSMVFETNDLNQVWDGNYRGIQLATDVYGYLLEIICFGGDKYQKSGSITLMH